MSFKWSHGGTGRAGGQRVSLAGITLTLAGGAMLLAACGGGGSSRSSTATQPPAASPTTLPTRNPASGPMTPTVVSVSNSRYGPILADARGLSLYTATGDTATTSGCTGVCLKYWPPLLLPAGQTQPIAGPGITGLGTFMRSDGVQVTYHGRPLYTWVKDTQPGQVTGQGVVDSGGTWYVASVGAATNPAAARPSTAVPSVTQAPATTATTRPAAPSSGGASF